MRHIDTNDRYIISPSLEKINLIKGYRRRMTVDKLKKDPNLYKSIYKRLPMKLSSTNFAEVYILHTISKSKTAMYGSEIVEEITSTLCDESIWKPANGTLYPSLRKLVELGLLEKRATDKRNNKKLYKITEKGENMLILKKNELRSMIEGSESFFNKLGNELFDDY